MKFNKSIIAPLLISIIFTALASCLYINIELGSDPISVFMDGFNAFFNMSYGNASRLYNVITLILAFVFCRKNIGWTTIAYALGVGIMIDIINPLLATLQMSQFHIIFRFVLIGFAQILYGIAFAILIVYKNGMSQADALAEYISNTFTFPFPIARIAIDFITFMVGVCLGGVFGIGTIIAVTTTGFMVKFAMKYIVKEK